MGTKTNIDWLYEISFMRPILLVLLVSYHAFAPWCGAWDMPTGCVGYEPYRWIALLSRAFRLECFVFVSGYIFTFQVLTKNKFARFTPLLTSKIVRLLVPCWVFSIIYFICFKNYTTPVEFLLTIFGGAGHLWYLPCLFVCFIGQFFLIKRQLNDKIVLLVLVFLAFISFVPLPLHLNKPLYYMLFFWGGGMFYQNKDKIAAGVTQKRIIVSWIVFVVLLVVINLFFENSAKYVPQNTIQKGLFIGFKTLLKALLAWVGIYSFYATAVSWCRKHQVKEWALKVGICGYGVYVFHQFILVWLYDYTTLPQHLGTYWLPWIGFMIATMFSLALTLLIRTTSVGRKFL